MACPAGNLYYSLIDLRWLDQFHYWRFGLKQFSILNVKVFSDSCALLLQLLVFTIIVVDKKPVVFDFNFLNPLLILRLNHYHIFEWVILRIHAPEIEFVGGRSDCETLSHFNTLNGIIFLQTLLHDLEVILQPAIIRVAQSQIYQCLEVDYNIKQWTLLFEFIQKFQKQNP